MNNRSLILLLAGAFLAASCGPSEEEKAAFRLKQIRNFLSVQDTASALVHLDSIPLLHPKATITVNAAKNLKREVYWEILQRRQVALDSVTALITRLQENFVYTKGEFEKSGRYIHARQQPEQNLSRSFLRAEVLENGELVMVSQLVGMSGIRHDQVRVYDGDLEAKTDFVPVGSADQYSGGFLGSGWERVTFRNGKENGVTEFIAGHAGLKLKAAFLGKGSYVIFLEESDKKAFREAFSLSRALIQQNKLRKEISAWQIL